MRFVRKSTPGKRYMAEYMEKEAGGCAKRGSVKLRFALENFGVKAEGMVAADLGSHAGGFTDILLAQGAVKVYAVDTGYGQLSWDLRNDKRVVVMERTNALYAELPEKVDLVTIDVGWTAQRLIIPKALSFLKPGGEIVSLVKPHYEAKNYGIRALKGRLREEDGLSVLRSVIGELASLGIPAKKSVKSPITGGKGKNIEYFIWIKTRKKH